MTITKTKEIILQVLQEHLKEYTERPKQLSESLFTLMINLKENQPLNSKYITPLKSFFKKVDKEKYLKQISNRYTVKKVSKKYQSGDVLKSLKTEIILRLKELPDQEPKKTDIKIKELSNFDMWSINKIYSHCDGWYHLPLEAKQKEIYFDKVGREYNNFNRLRGYQRAFTSTPYEIDLSSAVQVIQLNQFNMIWDESQNKSSFTYTPQPDPNRPKFKAIENYIKNKRAFREKHTNNYKLTEKNKKNIKDKTETRENILKKFLTKLSFDGSGVYEINKRFDYPKEIIELYHEQKILNDTISEAIDSMDSRLPIKKHIQTRVKEKEENQTKKVHSKKGRKLFYWFEYQEQKIRACMLEYVNKEDTKQVHDAIYTSTRQDLQELQKYILLKTGFDVRF